MPKKFLLVMPAYFGRLQHTEMDLPRKRKETERGLGVCAKKETGIRKDGAIREETG